MHIKKKKEHQVWKGGRKMGLILKDLKGGKKIAYKILKTE